MNKLHVAFYLNILTILKHILQHPIPSLQPRILPCKPSWANELRVTKEFQNKEKVTQVLIIEYR